MLDERGKPTPGSGPKGRVLWAISGLTLWVGLWFGDLLFWAEGRIASHAQGDAVRSFVYLRQFGFDQWASGNFPLWNPHLFSGTPFVGSFQSSMLYPPTWAHWVLPLDVAINFEMAVSVYLLMLGSFFWARSQRLSVSASFLSATMVGLGGTVSLRVLAGALTVLASYAWFPWLLLGLDRVAERRNLGAWLLVTGAAAMVLLAGHPPTAFMIFCVLGLYFFPRWLARPHPGRGLGLLVLAASLSVSMAALQLAVGYDTAMESVRRGGVGLDFATAWSFPPENWLTLWAPTFFGDASATRVDYFGRWWFWDDVAFVGVTGTALAILGVLWGRHSFRKQSVILVLILGMLAIGRSTPVFGWAFHWVPGFDLIRAPSKFMFFVTFFLAFWAGLGWDRLLGTDREATAPEDTDRSALQSSVLGRFAWLMLAVGVLLLCGGAWIGLGVGQGSDALMRWLAPTPAKEVMGPMMLRQWMVMASSSFWIAGGTATVLSVVLLAARRFRFLLLGVLVLACIELFGFAFMHRGGVLADAGMRQRHGQKPVFDRLNDLRLMESGIASNAAMGFGIGGIWGYDPVVLERYAMLVARSQDRSVEQLDNVRGQPPDRDNGLLRLLRLGAIVEADPARRLVQVEWPGDPLDRFEFVSEYQIENDPEAILGLLESTAFDPRSVAVLEALPSVQPSGELPTQVSLSIVSKSTDHVELKVTLDRPSLLLWTDSYAEGWKVEALPGSVQADYRAQPANLTIRSVSLEAGVHHFRWVYQPAHLRLGIVLSVVGWLAYGGLFGFWALWKVYGKGSEPAPV